MMRALSGIMITGTSHVGKTSFAHRLADKLGWTIISTDELARHPGRPWPTVRPTIAEYYQRLSSETIHWFLKVHHKNIWPVIRRKIEDEIHAGRPFIFEGAALRPEYLATLNPAFTSCICLYAEADFLQERMRSEAGYSRVDALHQAIIDKFIERSLRENIEMQAAAQTHHMKLVNVADSGAMDELYDELKHFQQKWEPVLCSEMRKNK
ncbi:AAA family ATPase [Ochrobactrum quorumnocens]|uniref:ATP-binding protein n=1 Tax=Ochrobactrum quorumnocens TaxID=271865 RepID=A0A5N1JXF8_9HYPH|nr:ATP-binding protein [[Ochrobactrum] quorumnocens]